MLMRSMKRYDFWLGLYKKDNCKHPNNRVNLYILFYGSGIYKQFMLKILSLNGMEKSICGRLHNDHLY